MMGILDKLLCRKGGSSAIPDPYWSQFEDAYGPANEVPRLLADMSPDWNDPVWAELWSRLCHQGTVYSASFAAVPHLVAFAATVPATKRSAPLALAGAISAAPDPGSAIDVVDTAYADAVAQAVSLAVEAVNAAGTSQGELVACLQAYAAFKGHTPFALWLDAVAEGEVELECPRCNTFLWVHPVQSDPHVSAEDSRNSGSLARPTTPVPPSAAELQQLAGVAGFPLLAAAIELMYGQASCPACRATFVPAEERTKQDVGAA